MSAWQQEYWDRNKKSGDEYGYSSFVTYASPPKGAQSYTVASLTSSQ